MAEDGDPEPKEMCKVRGYQDEMLQESMQRNIIVAADTGSGKTFIAILRIQAELERCPSEKLVWFCVPTVALAIQQHKAISMQLPAFQARVLSGADNVDFWTEQWIWDDVLRGIRIVVSTHQVLLDALIHGFVRMRQLALMVFDEAHSCIGKHPSSRILHDFYHTSKVDERPAILGLTASPVINSKVGNLGTLESNLNAISRTPKLHREELFKFVHRPELIRLDYSPSSTNFVASPALESLGAVFEGLDIKQDPWIIKMKSDQPESNALREAMINHKTYCHDRIKGLYDKALAIFTELGSSAADYYIHQSIQKFQRQAVDGSYAIEGLKETEKDYLRQKFGQVEIPNQAADSMQFVTPKVWTLIDFVESEEAAAFSGLIFVRTRAEVAVLSHLLSIHVASFSISTFVGASSFSGRKNTVGELADIKNQKDTLDDLRYGSNHLVVTTSALEEGIDVAKCNVVICFDRPPNLKSFIQRRGRARKAFSKYVIMFEDDGSNSSAVSTWLKLEDEMRQMYMDEMRELQELQALENIEESGKRELINESTGAKLTLDDAVQHLYHFCATLPAAPYVDLRPIFSFEDHSPGSELRSISAKVVLPNSIDVSVREASSTSQWKTEKMARRDAAFEAYAALFHAGLINENFLPLGHVDDEVDEAYTAIEKRPSLVEVQDQVNPWLSIAQEWQDPNHIKTATIKIKEGEECISEMLMFLPCSIPIVYDFDLHWDATTTYQATFKSNLIAKNQSVKEAAAQVTALLLHSQFDSRMDIDRCDFTALFVPPNVANLHDWAEERSGTTKALDLCESNARGNNSGLVRDLSEDRRPHIFHDMRYASLEDIRPDGAMDIDQHDAECRDSIHENNLPNPQMDSEWRENKDLANLNDSQVGGSRPENGTSDENEELDQDRTIEEGPTMDKCMGTLPQNHTTNEGMGVDENDKYQGSILLEVTRLPKKVDFLHHTPEQDAKNAKQSTTRILLAKTCVMDKLPFTYSRFAGFIPSILHKVKVAMIVDRLCETILSPLQFRYRDVVATAIAAPSANEGTDYNRLEFRGDSCLKSFASLVLMAGHLNYHEGILSHQKDHIVSNSSLASAAIQRGLAPFILTKAFTGDKGRPLYNGNLLQDQTVKPREMSSKTLADVVEALVGAAYQEGGAEKALACLEIFLPEVPWSIALRASEILHKTYDQQIPSSAHLAQVETLIQYEFSLKPLLTEALTHPSHHGPNSSASYQRLEFLGDSVLDNIVTTTAFAHEPPIATHNLHLVRAALVNGHFLGYLCLTLFTNLQRTDPVADDPRNISTVEVSHPFYLWQSMRHASPAVRSAQQACLARLETIRTEIAEAFTTGSSYPWTLLARLEPPKFFSDVIESLLGAIYIDTHGSLTHCETFLEHLELMSYLRRVIEHRVAILHPKDELGQLSDQDAVKYVLGKEGEEGSVRLTCTIMVGDREAVRVGDGLSVMEVQTRAADEACRIMRREGRKIRNDMGYSNEKAGAEVHEEEQVEEEVEEDRDQGMDGTEGTGHDSDEYMTADER